MASQFELGDHCRHLIGVIDLVGGRAVHAVAGNRASYRPIDQTGCLGGNPVELLTSYLEGQSEENAAITTDGGLYIADLDAISGRQEVASPVVEDLIRCFYAFASRRSGAADDLAIPGLWVDANWGQACWRPSYWGELHGAKTRLLLSTETLEDWIQVDRALCTAKELECQLAVSIDLKYGDLVCRAREMRGYPVTELIQRFSEKGISEFVVLDTAAVGTSSGPVNLDILHQISDMFGRDRGAFRLISGGGVRGIEDVGRLCAAGCEWVLVATWLQRLWIADRS